MFDKSRIVITGAAGVGKTTLAKKFVEALNELSPDHEYEEITEVAKQLCEERGYENIYAVEDHFQFRHDVLEKQIALEDAIMERDHKFISDRSTLDCWVYFMRWSWTLAMVEDTEKYYQRCASQAAKYDLIVYIPKMFNTVEDNFRWANETYQNQIDRVIKSTLFEWDLMDKTYTITADNPEDRVQELIEYLKVKV